MEEVRGQTFNSIDELTKPSKKVLNAYEYQKKAKQRIYDAALLIQCAIQRNNVELTAEERAALLLLTRKPGSGNKAVHPLLYKLFGEILTEGASISALSVFEKTGKGLAEMRTQINKWRVNGIIVDFDEFTKMFTIRTIPGNL
jgi:hypothetical protein